MKRIDKDGIKVSLLILCSIMFAISCVVFTSALDFDNIVSEKELIKYAPIMIGEKEIPYNELWTKYPVIEIDNAYGLDIPFLDNKLASLALTEHTESCGQDCFSEFTISTNTNSALVEDVKFYTLVDDGVELENPREQNIRSYQFYYWGDVIDYETQCIEGKTIIDEKNGTEYTPQECSQVEVGSHEGWINYNVGDVLPAGTYQVKLEGSKRPSHSVDWVIKTQGKMINEWAVWNNNGPVTILAQNASQYYTTSSSYVSFKNFSLPLVATVLNITDQISNDDATAAQVCVKAKFYLQNGSTYESNENCTTSSSSTWKNVTMTNPINNSSIIKVELFGHAQSLHVFYEINTVVYGYYSGVAQLNSPSNNSISTTTLVTTNASATVTGGAYLVNATLFDNSTGSWGARNSTTYLQAPFVDTFSTFNKANWANGTATCTASGNVLTCTPATSNYRVMMNLTNYTSIVNLTITCKSTGTNPLCGATINRQSSSAGQGGTEYAFTAEASTITIRRSGTIVASSSGSYDIGNYHVYTLMNYNNGTISLFRDGIGQLTYFDSSRIIGGYTGLWLENTDKSLLVSKYEVNSQAVNSVTQTFTNTYPTGSNILWNYQFCDSDGACGFATSNYTFTVDNTPPQIALNYPTALIDYGANNQTLQLNFTATDTNLQSCWYNYNGTNITTSCSSGIPVLSNITLSTKKNVTIYANDTAGNLNATTFSWDYKVFENSRTFNTTSLELTTNSYILNLTNNVNTTSVTLNYDGIDYSATGSNGVYTTTLTVPAVNITSNKTLYWKILYNNLETINTYSSNQTLQSVVFSLCNATINQTLINFTTKSATNPFPLVNTTFKIAFDYSLSSGGTQKTFNYEDIAGNKSSYAFCSNNNLTIYTNAEVEYDASGYALNFYYLTGEETLSTSSSRNISIYLLNDSLATVTQLKVQDSSQRGLPNYRIDVYSYDTGTGAFYLVGMAKTDFNGLDIFYFNWFDTIYKFLVYDSSGNLVKDTGNTKVSNTPVTITLSEDINFTQDKFEGFTKNLSFNAVTNNFVLTFTKPSVLVQSVCLRVDKQNSSGNNKICDTCTNATSATLYCSVGSYGNGTYIAYVYATGSRSIIDLLYASIGGDFQDTIYALLGNKDASFYAFLFATLVMLAMFVHPVMGILGLFLGILGASALGFTSLNWSQFLGIAVVGGCIIWVLKR